MPRSGSVALLAAFLFACTGTVSERNWIEVATTNFRITSTLGQAAAIDLAEQLELFRAVIQAVTNAPTVDSPIPTRLFVFDQRRDFMQFTKSRDLVGVFVSGMRANYIVMRDRRSMTSSTVLRHEYVHFVMNNATSRLYPMWYSEGFAEFLSTVTLHSDGIHVIVGAFPSDRRVAFEKGISMPYEQVISARPGSTLNGTMLYEQSWALVHWLQLGRSSDRSFERDMDRYLDLIEAGRTDADAFEDAFGITLRDLRTELIEYLNGNYRAAAISLASLEYTPASPRVRALQSDEISVALGDLALAFYQEELAQDLFTAAGAANPENARAHSGLGRALAADGRLAEAEPHFARAVSIGASDAAVQLDYAEYLHQSAVANGDGTPAQPQLDSARTHYRRSWKLDRRIPETYAMYGRSFLARGEDPTRALRPLESARKLLPAHPTILSWLARAYVLCQREAEARALIARIVAIQHAGDRVARVDELLASIRGESEESW